MPSVTLGTEWLKTLGAIFFQDNFLLYVQSVTLNTEWHKTLGTNTWHRSIYNYIFSLHIIKSNNIIDLK
jgi:hypothetical protein